MSEKKIIGEADNDKKGNTVIIERCLKLLEYFRHNTDAKHTITQKKMRDDLDNNIADYMGNKTSFNKMIKNMAIALNFDDDGCVKPLPERKLLFHDFSMMYDEFKKPYRRRPDVKTVPIKDIYYNHAFSHSEVQDIIMALRTSDFIDTEHAENLIEKIKNELASKYFHDSFVKIYKNEHTVSKKLVDNLSLISNALINHHRLKFKMSYYNGKKQLIPYGDIYTISPDFIILNNGRYYVVGCFEYENENENDKQKNLAIIRIDMMSDISESETRATSMYDIPALRQVSEDKFRSRHLNMSYDDYLFVEMKIKKTPKTDNEVNYTFIHDNFGDQYIVVKKEEDGDIVRVLCSKYGIINWAVQYGDLVEVISPDSVIKEIKMKIEMLREKYSNDEKEKNTNEQA